MNWTEEIDINTKVFMEAFGSLNKNELNWKPDADTWSIAQNIDHLITINSTYFQPLSDLRKGKYRAPFMGKIGFMVSFFGNAILKSVLPDNTKKTKTFPIWEPAQSDLPENILELFVAHQDELKNNMASSRHLAEQGAVISSPANKNIAYKLETAFDIIVTHEKRHYEQAKRVLAQLNSSKVGDSQEV